jgi:OmpA-OmpF porin, OOP family
MTQSFSRNQISLAIAYALAIGTMSSAFAAEIDHADAGLLTDVRGSVVRSGFGLCWNAGSPATANLECDPKPAPAPVAKVVAPAPAPIVVAAVAPKPVAERVTLDADTLFDFDKSTLRPAGREALDTFVAGLKDISPEVISAVGHTDRFGTDAYNQHLSDQRAASVKAYLVSKGIDANRVATEGKGETQPVTKSGECLGAKSTKIVACLQPDRRVDVEVIGNRINRLTMQ